MAIDYIENNLDNDIDLNRISEIAFQSVSNFQKVFSIMADLPLAEYIRRRRLTLAAFELLDKKVKVIDIALKYRYESPEAFARAFRVMHGVSPTEAKKDGISLKAFPRISFLLTVKGVNNMEFKIEQKEAFQVYGLEDAYAYDGIKNNQGRTIPEVWQDLMKDVKFEALCKSTPENWYEECGFSKKIGVIFAYDSYKHIDNLHFPYLIGCYKTSKSKTDGFTVVDVPKSTWAIFSTKRDETASGNYDLGTLKKRIYSEWLPTSKYNIIDGGNFEMYCSGENGGYCELWYRVEEK